MEIETYNPSEITYPENIRKILIVNNATPQPADVGYVFNLFGIPQHVDKVETDSALFDACRALGTAIAGTDFFDDVLFFHERTNKDDNSLKLTPQEVNCLCEETETDAVISFDHLLFDMQKEITAFTEGYVAGSIRIDVKGIARSYLPGKVSPAITVLASDSIFLQEDAYTLEELTLRLPTPDETLRIAGNYIGSKLYSLFVPHWKNEMRWYFSGNGARWKEATVYAVSGKWENASERWQYIYNSSTRWSEKAKSASNLALASEIAERLEKALEWAKIAHNLFESKKGNDHSYTQMQQLYVNTLEKRILNDKKLNLQFRRE
jgi:hypothetical protein